MSKKPKLPVMLDLETLSLKANAAVVDVAFCAATGEGVMHQWYIRPESYTNSFEFDVNPETLAFHHNQGSGLIGTAEHYGKSWREVAQYVYEYLSLLGATYEVHLWTKGKDADIPWLSNLLQSAGYKLPWVYKNAHCLRDLGMLFPEVQQTTWGNHTAARDVEAQIKYLIDLAGYSDRAYHFIYGD